VNIAKVAELVRKPTGLKPSTCDAGHTSPVRLLARIIVTGGELRVCPVMQTLAITAIVFGLAASAAWTGFLIFELLQLMGLL
jgi:multisubunit Na+/H+ antiporter MnhC subunit